MCVTAERPFSDFPGLVELQRLNGLPLGLTYSNDKQAKVFIGFIAEEIRFLLIRSLEDGDFSVSISFDTSTNKGNIDEEM